MEHPNLDIRARMLPIAAAFAFAAGMSLWSSPTAAADDSQDSDVSSSSSAQDDEEADSPSNQRAKQLSDTLGGVINNVTSGNGGGLPDISGIVSDVAGQGNGGGLPDISGIVSDVAGQGNGGGLPDIGGLLSSAGGQGGGSVPDLGGGQGSEGLNNSIDDITQNVTKAINGRKDHRDSHYGEVPFTTDKPPADDDETDSSPGENSGDQ